MRGNFRWYAAHCGKGHLYDEVNTRVDERGYQRCRRCDRERQRRALMIPKTKWRIPDDSLDDEAIAVMTDAYAGPGTPHR